MLRYTTDRARPGLVALYDIQPGNGVDNSYNPGARMGLNFRWYPHESLVVAGRAFSQNCSRAPVKVLVLYLGTLVELFKNGDIFEIHITGCVKSSQPTLTCYNFDKGGSIFMIFFTVKFRKDLRRKMQ